jgi:H+-translocating NAD(P) transhydrogenase subunit alpha
LKAVICKETHPGEQRVAITPEGVTRLVQMKFDVAVESGAGESASYTDADYSNEGAVISDSRSELFSSADILLAVNIPAESDLKLLKKGAVLISFMWPLQHPETVELLCQLQVTALAVDTIPRISRAQSMDALSTMSNIAGYKAVLEGANLLDRYLPMLMTAAGTIRPAKVLVLGAGVAGLQAIATARRLGAVVEAFDVRPVVKEQVESLGARFVDVQTEEETETEGGYAKEVSDKEKEKQRDVLTGHIQKSDMVITTALIPGKPAPLLITQKMAETMAPGSVIVDIAAEQGGNCELTRPGETVNHHGVKIMGLTNIPSTLAYHASKLYSKNLISLLQLLVSEGKLTLNFDDEIVLNTTVTHNGQILSPFVKENMATT